MVIKHASFSSLRVFGTGRSTREAILASATRLMGVHGYRNTSLDDVLRESGVGKGNFYHYFRSKEELGYAILDQFIEVFLDRTFQPCFSEGGGRPLEPDHVLPRPGAGDPARAELRRGCPLGNLAAELSDLHEGFREPAQRRLLDLARAPDAGPS